MNGESLLGDKSSVFPTSHPMTAETGRDPNLDRKVRKMDGWRMKA